MIINSLLRHVGKPKFSLETFVFSGMFDFHFLQLPPPLPLSFVFFFLIYFHPDMKTLEGGGKETPAGGAAVLQRCSRVYSRALETSALHTEPLLSFTVTGGTRGMDRLGGGLSRTAHPH